MKVVVLGASPNRDRYSNTAVRDLVKYGHEVIPVNPYHAQIEGLAAAKQLADIETEVDTLTVYVGPQNIGPLIDEIIALRPKRVILNPGAESAPLIVALDKNNIPYMEACTLVMLRTKTF